LTAFFETPERNTHPHRLSREEKGREGKRCEEMRGREEKRREEKRREEKRREEKRSEEKKRGAQLRYINSSQPTDERNTIPKLCKDKTKQE